MTVSQSFLGRSGEFDGEDIIAMIMEQPATAEYIAGKIYRFFVRTELSKELQSELGCVEAANMRLLPC